MRFASLMTLSVLLVPTPGRAQLSGALSVGSGVGQRDASAWTRESRLSPTLRFLSPQSALSMDATVAERGGPVSLDHAAITSLLTTPAFVGGAFRFSVEGDYRLTDRVSVASFAPAVSVRRGGVGAWFGSAHAEASAPRLTAGAWTSIRSLVFSIATRTQSSSTSGIRSGFVWDSIPNDTMAGGSWTKFRRTTSDTVEERSTYRWSQLEARLDWSYRRLALTGSLSTSRAAAARFDSAASGPMTWGRVNGAFYLNHRMSIIAGAGSQPSLNGRSATARFATVGIRFSPAMLLRDPLPAPVRPAASAFTAKQVAPGLYRLVLRVAAARTVELSGDFNRWVAVAMQETVPGVWEVSLPLEPGTHRLNVRVNGDAWSAPPGLPAVNDEFSGRVGILVVR